MMRNSLLLCLWTIVLSLAGSCRSNGQGQADEGTGQGLTDTLPSATCELALPEVPSTLTIPEERAAYILEHFWDGMDFADTLCSRNPEFMEQNLVNFISLFPHARQENLSHYIGRLMQRVSSDSVAFHLVCDLAERYLNEPNSPMRNEEYYILFLEEWLHLSGLSEHDRIRPAYQLKTARKNRPGTVATDFTYVTRKNVRGTLHNTSAKRLLLLFYDPACSHCSEILDELRESPVLGKLVADKELAVLAVYTEGDQELWDKTKDDHPQEWTVAIDRSHIVERGLYSLPAMPVIYLLDKDKTVLLKDPSPALLEAFLSANMAYGY